MRTLVRVIVESPFKGSSKHEPEVIEKHRAYLHACLRDCLLRGEAPFASHAIYTLPGVLQDEIPEERLLGIDAGFAWRPACQKTAVYTDLGISDGMASGIANAMLYGHELVYRQLGPPWSESKE